MKNHVRLFEILFCIFALILAVMIPLSVAGSENTSVINDALGTTSYKEELTVDEDEIDWDKYNYYDQTYSSEEDLTKAYAALCKEVEEEGIVLMKNDNDALPLASGAKVSLFGQGSADWTYSSSGSSSTSEDAVYATLKEALETSGLTVNPDLWDFYLYDPDPNNNTDVKYYPDYHRGYGATTRYTIDEAPYDLYPSDVIASYANYGDAAIVTIARDSGEGQDLTAGMPKNVSAKNSTSSSYGLDGSYLSLCDTEVELLQELTSLKASGTFGSIIVLLDTSAMMQMDFLEMDGIDVDAVLWVGNTGSQGLLGVADVLCGNANPSGKNTDTYLKDNFSSPAMASWGYNDYKLFPQVYDNESGYATFYGAHTNENYGVYVEGIYVGYRYFETRYEDYVMGSTNVGDYDYGSVVAYPFGYGLSYTTFEYSDFSVTPSDDGESYDVKVTVTNDGSVPGKETVEVYLQKPYSDYDKRYDVEKASVELAGYAKTAELQPEESETVTVTVQKEQFKTYDANEAETYILDVGDYYLTVGQYGSHDAVNNILAAKGYTTSDGMDASGNENLATVAYTQSGTNPDTTTYSISSETGADITNQLDFADLKKYDGAGSNANAFEYVSRSDWEGTFPKTNVVLSVATEQMGIDLLTDNKIEDKGYNKPRYDRDSGLTLYDMMGLDYDDSKWDDLLDQMSYAEQSLLTTDGFHLTNAVPSVAKRATKDENGPTSVDGSVTPGYCFPSEGIWAATFNDELIGRIGELLGDDAIMAGVQGLYAPGVNMHRTAFGGRTHEYFSEDPYLSGMAAVDEIQGIQSRGVVAYVKHFAFNENEENRNGISIWLNEQSAREIYLVPFEYAMKPSMGNVHACMTSFNRAGCKWTSASSELLLNIARDEWDFDGFYITDSSSGNGATYMTYYDGIMNGTNLYDGTGTETALNNYKGNVRFSAMLRESSHRILYVTCNFSASMNGVTEYTVVYKVTPWWQALITSLEVISIVGVVASAALYVIAEVFKWRDKSGDVGNNGGGVHPKDADDDYDISSDVGSLNDKE